MGEARTILQKGRTATIREAAVQNPRTSQRARCVAFRPAPWPVVSAVPGVAGRMSVVCHALES